MKLFFISLLLLISYTVFGKYDTKQLLEYIKNDPISLNYGIKKAEPFKLQDFSMVKLLNEKADSSISLNSETIVPFPPVNEYWYIHDFAEDPFDGRIEVLVMGEPLPSTTVTLFLASILVFTVLKYNKLHKKGNVAYEY